MNEMRRERFVNCKNSKDHSTSSKSTKGLTSTNEAIALMEKHCKMGVEFWATNDLESATKVMDKYMTDDCLMIINGQKIEGKCNVIASWGLATGYISKSRFLPTLRQWHKTGFSYSETMFLLGVDGQEYLNTSDNTVVYDMESGKCSIVIFNSGEEYHNRFMAGIMNFLTQK
jgi:hypothetical protein